jgi:SWI/SNF-related matrix-associated actin-dependent regulator of chromatin subfamily A member 5
MTPQTNLLLDSLLARADAAMAKAAGLGTKKPAKKAHGKAANRSRMTEREEDEELLGNNLEEDELESGFSRLLVQPPNIVGTMREYQLEGLNWMIRLHHSGFSGILADEMGLGKTLQSISLLAYLAHFCKGSGPHLVCVPLTVMGNWMNELKRFCPTLRTFRLHGSKEERAELLKDGLDPSTFDVCVCSFEMASRERSHIKKVKWQYIVVDEAHRLKNENSLLSQMLRIFPSKARLLLTGTPLQNNLHELWALLNFLLPDLFSSAEEFDAVFQIKPGTSQEEQSIVTQLHRILRCVAGRRLFLPTFPLLK